MLWQNTNVQEMSPSILLWIKGHILSRKDDGGDPRHSYALVVDKVNPGLTDLFLKQARKVLQTPEKGSVLENSNRSNQNANPPPLRNRNRNDGCGKAETGCTGEFPGFPGEAGSD
jgi:hypothetical protein